MKWMISLLLALFFCVPAFVTSEKNVAAEGKSIRQPASVLLRTEISSLGTYFINRFTYLFQSVFSIHLGQLVVQFLELT